MAITAEIDKLVQEAAKKYGVPVNLVRTLIGAESGKLANDGSNVQEGYWDADPNAVSPAGAIGLMQLIPSTAASLGVNPSNVAQNIDGGVRYLKQQLDTFGGNVTKALAAYNAGPGAVQKYNGVPPYRETTNYVNKINAAYRTADQAFGDSSLTPVPASANVGTPADTATVQGAYNASAAAYGQSAEEARAAQANIQRMAAGMPDIAGATTQMLSESNAALANMSAASRQAIDSTFAALEQKDVARRAIMQSLLTDKNYDPLVQGSIADMSTDNLAMLNRRMNATILAEQATNEMSVLDNPAGFLEKVLFGNLYTQGRKELRSQFDDLKAVTSGTREEITAQGKLAGDVRVGSEELDKLKMDATLKMAEIDKDIAIAEAETPLKVAQAQATALEAQARMMGYAVDYGKQAAVATDQQQQATIQAVEAPYSIAGKQAAVTSAQAAADTASMDVALRKKYYDAESALMEVEMGAKTDESKRKAVEARAALNAALATAQSGKLDEAALQSALTQIYKVNAEFRQAAGTAGSNLPEQQLAAQQAQAEAALLARDRERASRAELDPAFAKLEKDAKMAQYQSVIDEISKAKGEAEALAQGALAIGLPKAPDVTRMSPEAKNTLIAVGAGQPAGTTPAQAALNLLNLNTASSDPALAQTAQAVLASPIQDAESGTAVPIGSLKPDRVAVLPHATVMGAISAMEDTKTGTTPIFSSSYIYGMVPPAALAADGRGTELQKKSLAELSATVDKNPAAATSIDSLITALMEDGKSNAEIARIVADTAQLSVDYNNNHRKFGLLGLEKQVGVNILMPGATVFNDTETLDMTKPADVQKQLMRVRAKMTPINVANPFTNTVYPAVPINPLLPGVVLP